MSNEPQNPDFPSSDNTEPDANFGPSGPAVGTLPPPPQAPPAGPPYRRNRAAVFFGVTAAVLLAGFVAMVGMLVVGIAAVAAVASGDIDFDTDTVEIEHSPSTLSELPLNIVEEKGSIEIDLTEVDPAEWSDNDGPVELDVRTDFGSITVIVPEGLEVTVDASVDVGEVEVFGNTSSGLGNSVVTSGAGTAPGTSPDLEFDLELDLDIDFGKIEVVRS